MRTWVPFLALLSGLRIQCCSELGRRLVAIYSSYSIPSLGTFIYHGCTLPTPQKKKERLKVHGPLFSLRATSTAYGSSQPRGRIRAAVAGLHHSHRNMGSELHLPPTSQLVATPDPSPTERGQGSNPQPHGSSSDSFPLRHDGNSLIIFYRCRLLCFYFIDLTVLRIVVL